LLDEGRHPQSDAPSTMERLDATVTGLEVWTFIPIPSCVQPTQMSRDEKDPQPERGCAGRGWCTRGQSQSPTAKQLAGSTHTTAAFRKRGTEVSAPGVSAGGAQLAGHVAVHCSHCIATAGARCRRIVEEANSFIWGTLLLRLAQLDAAGWVLRTPSGVRLFELAQLLLEPGLLCLGGAEIGRRLVERGSLALGRLGRA